MVDFCPRGLKVSLKSTLFFLLSECLICSFHRASMPDTVSLPGSGWAPPGQQLRAEQDVGPGLYHVYEVGVAICAEQVGSVMGRVSLGGTSA